MQKHICSLQISRICGAHALSVDHLTALYTALSLHYEHGNSAFGVDSLPTDFGASDSYGLLAGELGLFRKLFYNTCIQTEGLLARSQGALRGFSPIK